MTTLNFCSMQGQIYSSSFSLEKWKQQSNRYITLLVYAHLGFDLIIPTIKLILSSVNNNLYCTSRTYLHTKGISGPFPHSAHDWQDAAWSYWIFPASSKQPHGTKPACVLSTAIWFQGNMFNFPTSVGLCISWSNYLSYVLQYCIIPSYFKNDLQLILVLKTQKNPCHKESWAKEQIL